MPEILKIINLVKSFGGVSAVNNVSLTLKNGEILGLIGPNGAGKTTVLNCISSLFPITSGEIWFKKELISQCKSYQIARLGIGRTFQVVKPFEGMTVKENISIGAMFGRARKEHSRQRIDKLVEEILAFCHLEAKSDLFVSGLTIVDRKRLELARALAMEPDVLLLDEVMAGLTPTEIEGAIELILKIRAQGIAILVVEHVMKAIMAMCDRIVVLQQGRVIANGTPKQISKDENVIKAYLGARWAAASV